VIVNALVWSQWQPSRVFTPAGGWVDVPRGSLFASWATLAAREGVTVKVIRRVADTLRRAGFWEWARAGERAYVGNVFSIVNFEHYQDVGHYAGQAVGTETGKGRAVERAEVGQTLGRPWAEVGQHEKILNQSSSESGEEREPEAAPAATRSLGRWTSVWCQHYATRYAGQLPSQRYNAKSLEVPLCRLRDGFDGTDEEFTGCIAAYFLDEREALLAKRHPVDWFAKDLDAIQSTARERESAAKARANVEALKRQWAEENRQAREAT